MDKQALLRSFNTQPPEGGCNGKTPGNITISGVSTHSRPKAAATAFCLQNCGREFQHTAARRRLHTSTLTPLGGTCFNTQPPEGGCPSRSRSVSWIVCFNTQPPEGGCSIIGNILPCESRFQHTAARRRLHSSFDHMRCCLEVSTHSRPKAAADSYFLHRNFYRCFNTQPPEGGCLLH